MPVTSDVKCLSRSPIPNVNGALILTLLTVDSIVPVPAQTDVRVDGGVDVNAGSSVLTGPAHTSSRG